MALKGGIRMKSWKRICILLLVCNLTVLLFGCKDGPTITTPATAPAKDTYYEFLRQAQQSVCVDSKRIHANNAEEYDDVVSRYVIGTYIITDQHIHHLGDLDSFSVYDYPRTDENGKSFFYPAEYNYDYEDEYGTEYSLHIWHTDRRPLDYYEGIRETVEKPIIAKDLVDFSNLKRLKAPESGVYHLEGIALEYREGSLFSIDWYEGDILYSLNVHDADEDTKNKVIAQLFDSATIQESLNSIIQEDTDKYWISGIFCLAVLAAATAGIVILILRRKNRQ